MKNLVFIQEKFVNSLFFASRVAEKLKTNVATFPDLIRIRANIKEDGKAWNSWFTPFTTLYLGMYKKKRIIVVAHHLGPLSTEQRLLEWSQSGIKDEGSDREKYGQAGLPKVTQKEFTDLVEGKYGEVTVIDFETYQQGFSSHLSGEHIIASDALIDPLLRALFGAEMEKFVEKHLAISTAYALAEKKDVHAEKKIFQLGIRDRYGWHLFLKEKCDFPDEQPIGLFITLGCPASYMNQDLSVSTEIRVHDDLGLAKFVVLGDLAGDVENINFSPEKHWKQCLVKSEEVAPDFFVLIKKGNKFFTEYPKDGNRMDTGEIMFEVEHFEEIGKQTFFETTDCRFFLKYLIDEVKAVAPSEANAYAICGDIKPGEKVKVPVQFYNVKANTQYRVLRGEEVANDLPLLLRINNVIM